MMALLHSGIMGTLLFVWNAGLLYLIFSSFLTEPLPVIPVVSAVLVFLFFLYQPHNPIRILHRTHRLQSLERTDMELIAHATSDPLGRNLIRSMEKSKREAGLELPVSLALHRSAVPYCVAVQTGRHTPGQHNLNDRFFQRHITVIVSRGAVRSLDEESLDALVRDELQNASTSIHRVLSLYETSRTGWTLSAIKAIERSVFERTANRTISYASGLLVLLALELFLTLPGTLYGQVLSADFHRENRLRSFQGLTTPEVFPFPLLLHSPSPIYSLFWKGLFAAKN